jgi:uncharacterized protein with von Willebrand factor type A (vWA) domain
VAREFGENLGGDGRGEILPRTLLRFCDKLRTGGITVSTSGVIDALNAIALVDIFNQSEFYNTLLTTLVKRKEDQIPYDIIFNSFWRMGSPEIENNSFLLTSSKGSEEKKKNVQLPGETEEKAQQLQSDLTEEHDDNTNLDSAVVATYSPAEVLMKRDLSTLHGDDLEEIEQVLRSVARQVASTKSRVQPDERGIMDLRRTVRNNIQYGTELLKILRRRKRLRKNRLVLVCDVSGSMKTYSNFAIQYLYAIGKVFERIEVFLFSTQLTRVTAELQRDEFEATMKSLSDSVLHWGGGTKIGACLSTLLERYSHFVSRRTIIVIISDGMDTGDIRVLEDQMRKLRQRSRWVVWLNPLLGDPDYEPICRGMQAALPYLNMFTSANSVLELQKFTQMLRYEPVLRVRG